MLSIALTILPKELAHTDRLKLLFHNLQICNIKVAYYFQKSLDPRDVSATVSSHALQRFTLNSLPWKLTHIWHLVEINFNLEPLDM